MHLHKRKHIILVVVVTVILLCLFSFIPSIGMTSLLSHDFTLISYLYLPQIVKQPTPTATAVYIPPDDFNNEQSIANSLNQIRNENGLSSLIQVYELTQAGRRHSRDMADHNFTSHTGSDGSNFIQRIQEAGYNNWTVAGEIIGWGFGGNAGSIVNWWMNSPSHKSIILSSNFKDFGVGYAINPGSDWGYYWTVDFGSRDMQNVHFPQELYICTFTSQDPFGGSSLIVYSTEPCQ